MTLGTILLELKCAMKLPILPNFMRSIDGETAIDVADLSDDDLRATGQAWTDALIEHAKHRRDTRAELS